MSPAPAAAPSARPAPATPAIIILGADALLAVRPATPGQLTNACYAAGYSAVIPASWGDELVAAGCLNEIAARGQDSVVLCSCPRVAERLRRVGNLVPHLLAMASPPVLAARYLRARAGATGVHITYVGDCPGASDPAIDRHATPNSLLRSLTKRGIVPTDQSSDVDERLTRDARRFYSLPGGAPAPNWLYAEKRGYTLIEPSARDFLAEVAFRISENERRVIDLAPRLGCACSGAVVGEPWTGARDAVAAMEPPRAVHEVLDHDVPLELGVPLEPWAGSAAEGQPTLALPLAELAALHDPRAQAPAVRHSPPPPVSRPSRPVTRPVGEPSTGATLTPAASSTVTAPGANRQRPFDRPRPPEPRTAPPPEPRPRPRPRSLTPSPVSVLPPVPPMPAHLAAQASARWTPPQSATPARAAVPSTPGPSDRSPSGAPTPAGEATADAPRTDAFTRAPAEPVTNVATDAATDAVTAVTHAPPDSVTAPSADAPAAVMAATVPLPQPSRSPFAPPLQGQSAPVASQGLPAPLASHLDLLPSEAEAVPASPSAADADALGSKPERTSAAVAITVEPRNSTAMREPPTQPRLRRKSTRLYTMAAACGIVAVAAASVVMFRVVPIGSAPPPGPRAESTTTATPAAATTAPSGAAPMALPAPSADTLSTASTPSLTDTVALPGPAPTPRLPIGPAATPAAYARGRSATGSASDTAIGKRQFHANPAAVYAPGAAPIPRTEAVITASRPKAPTAAPKTAAELRARAAFSDALTPEAAAEMAAVRSAVASRRHRADSLKHVADSAGSR